VHTTPIRDSNLVTRKIANLRWLLCASPDYLKTHGELETPRDLARHQCLVHTNSDPSDRVWRLRFGNGQVSIKVQGLLASNSVLMLRKAALESLGIGILPFYCVKEDLSSIGFANVPSRSRLGLGAFRSSHWPQWHRRDSDFGLRYAKVQ
jgi:DNA-binding transcriptional LysR family regulator